MQNAIYYPGFEVKDVNWLKFALLYIENLQPIIPLSGDNYLSESYRRIMGETDLITPYRPRAYNEVVRASSDALMHVENILKEPDRYTEIFGNNSFIQKWQDPRHQSYLLFQEKYTVKWEEFCISHKLAHRTTEGLLLAPELSWLFMSFLAQAIADANNLPLITDHPELDKISILSRNNNQVDRTQLQVAQNVVGLRLPADIETIDLHTILKFRNQPHFRQCLQAFHVELVRHPR